MSQYVVNVRSSVVHHITCQNTKGSPALIAWTSPARGDRACQFCLPNGLPEVTA